MGRTLVLVDGHNLFHALRELNPSLTSLNLTTLCNQLGRKTKNDQIEIHYFTSLLEHLNFKNRTEQFDYLENLKDSGVKIVLGEFMAKTETCPLCGNKYWVHTEKRTDVALAVEMVRQAHRNTPDEILLFSADTDFLPAVDSVKKDYSNISIRAVSTVKYLRPIHSALSKAGAGQIRLSEELVSKHQFV